MDGLLEREDSRPKNRMQSTAEWEILADQVSKLIDAGDSSEPARRRELAEAVFEFQARQNPGLAAWMKAAGGADIKRRGPTGLPIAAFKELDITVLESEARVGWFESSGTTSDRKSRHYHNLRTLALYEQSVLGSFIPHLFPEAAQTGRCPQMAALSLIPTPGLAPHSSLARMMATALEWMGAESVCAGASVDRHGTWVFDFDAIARWLAERSGENLPVALFGTAFGFVLLADHLAGGGVGFTLPPGSRVMETGGYKGRSRVVSKSELHLMISRALGVPASRIVTEYGMCELGSQAYDHVAGEPSSVAPEERIFHFPPWAWVRCLSPETLGEVGEGEPGLIEVTDLANAGSSVAILTEDLGMRRGDGFQFLGRREEAGRRGCSLMHA